jgi:hypothetical protein
VKIPSFLFGAISILSVLATVFSEKFLPVQFTRDSWYFQQRINSLVTGETDSFQVIVNFYQRFGITQSSAGLRLVQWFIFFFALLISRSMNKVIVMF